MARKRLCGMLGFAALAVLIACPAWADEKKDAAQHDVRVEMHAAGPGQEPRIRMWVNGEEIQPGGEVPADVGQIHAESITDPDAGVGDGKGAKARTHTRIKVQPDQPGGQPRVRMWINGEEVDPAGDIEFGEGKARVRIQAAPGIGERGPSPGEGAVLGVHIAPLGDDRAREVGVDHGVAVTGVVEGSPANRGGLREGDVITAVDGQAIRSPEELVGRIQRCRPGQKVRIEWHRRRARIEATIALAGQGDLNVGERRRDEDREAQQREERQAREREEREARQRNEAEKREHEEARGGFLGVLAAPLNDDIREIAGTDKGVLINSLTDDSPAAKAGLKPGDVIVRLGDADVHGVDQLVEALRDRKPGQRVHVVYFRMGKRRETEVTLGGWPGEEGKAPEQKGLPGFEDLFGGKVPDLQEYFKRLQPNMEEWMRQFREQQPRLQPALPEGVQPRRPGREPEAEGQSLNRILERLKRIEDRLKRIEERLGQRDR